MKAIKVLGFAVMTFMAAWSQAGEKNGQLIVEVTGERSIRVSIENDLPMVLKLKTSNGKELAKLEIEGGRPFAKSFDFGRLPLGGYQLEWSDDKKVETLPVVISGHGIEIDFDKQVVSYRPVIHQRGKKIIVNWFKANENGAKIQVYDHTGLLLYSGELVSEDASHLGKILDFSESPDGRYSVVVGNRLVSTTRSVNIR